MKQNENNDRTILFLVPWMTMGGSEKFNLDMMKHLKKADYKIIVCTTEPSTNDWQDRFEVYSDAIYHLPEKLSIEERPKFVLTLIQEERVDTVFISNSLFGFFILPWLKENSPRNFVAIDYIHMEEPYWHGGGFAKFSSTVKEYLDKTYVTYDRFRQKLIDDYHYQNDKIEVAYVCVDAIDDFNPDFIPSGQIREKWAADGQTAVILFPCRLHVQKRPYLMIEIAKELRSRGNNFVIWVVGDGPEQKKMKRLVKKYKLRKHVMFLGSTRDVRPYYKDADLTLICSILEGVTFSSYESMAMETPVISSDVGGQKELITPEAGYILPTPMNAAQMFDEITFTPEEVKAFVEVIETCINDKESLEKMGKKSRNRILEHFRQDLMFLKMMEDLHQMSLQKNETDRHYDLTEALSIMMREFRHFEWLLEQKAERLSLLKGSPIKSKKSRKFVEKYLWYADQELGVYKEFINKLERENEISSAGQLCQTYIKLERAKLINGKIEYYFKKLQPFMQM